MANIESFDCSGPTTRTPLVPQERPSVVITVNDKGELLTISCSYADGSGGNVRCKVYEHVQQVGKVGCIHAKPIQVKSF